MVVKNKPSRVGFGGYEKVTVEYDSDPMANPPIKTTYEHQPGKTLWDWLQLLIIPIMLAGATIWFGWWQVNLAQKQHDNDLMIAQDNRQSDYYNALDQQQEAILQTYLDNMSDLLLKDNLRNSKPGDEVRQLARTRTLITLRRLYEIRPCSQPTQPTQSNSSPVYNICSSFPEILNPNVIVLQFLQDANLINGKNVIVDLSHADLSLDDLDAVNLSNVNLSSDDLYGTSLYGVDLSGAIITQHQLDEVSTCLDAKNLPKKLKCNNNH